MSKWIEKYNATDSEMKNYSENNSRHNDAEDETVGDAKHSENNSRHNDAEDVTVGDAKHSENNSRHNDAEDVTVGDAKHNENQNDNLQFHYRIHGRVQGVGFRKWLEDLSQAMGVDGFCRNLSDGTVELVAKASDKKILAALEKKLDKGPMVARVDQVIKTPWKEQVPRGFRILNTK